jgi:large subunit ribosomal protein L6
MPNGIHLTYHEQYLLIRKGVQIIKLRITVPLEVTYAEGKVRLKPLGSSLALWGTFRSHIHAVVSGLAKNYRRSFHFIGVGYKAVLKNRLLILRLGFSHKVFVQLPQQVTLTKIKKRPPTFSLESADKSLLSLVAFRIRSFKKAEPYKGKGILFLNEGVTRKVGKKTSK